MGIILIGISFPSSPLSSNGLKSQSITDTNMWKENHVSFNFQKTQGTEKAVLRNRVKNIELL